ILLDRQELARIGQGEIVGEISFLDERPPIATVKAIAPSLLLAIPRLRLLPKLNRDDGFAARFYRGLSLCLADRMRDTVQRLGYGLDIHDLYREPTLDPLKAEQLQLAQMKFDWLVKAAQPR
ncbi:MAG: cyclic nucleotide-binding domain-containing protein, partial [Myxococcales bacterium]|nr:cyclic nucleotide-binding domain-containing protein [Myxococcales bacterium]